MNEGGCPRYIIECRPDLACVPASCDVALQQSDKLLHWSATEVLREEPQRVSLPQCSKRAGIILALLFDEIANHGAGRSGNRVALPVSVEPHKARYTVVRFLTADLVKPCYGHW